MRMLHVLVIQSNSIKTRVIDRETDEEVSVIKMSFDEAGLTKKKKLVGLTEEEVDDIWNRYCDELGEASINDAPDIVRAIEARLEEKNK